MPRRADRPIEGHRDHHLGVVVPINRPRVNPRHPSTAPPKMFDQDAPDTRPDRVVTLTRMQAHAIAVLLATARAHLPSPKACDEAVYLLTGKRK